MRTLSLCALALVVLAGCIADPPSVDDPLAAFRPGVAEGRRGARLLGDVRSQAADSVAVTGADARIAEAEGAFGAGLATPDVSRGILAKLWHGLGLARAERGGFAEADSALADALARADDPRQRARYAFDAGTAALLADDDARAVDLLRRSLVLDPDNADARRNYQIARIARDLDPEPSDFARQVKARADSLVGARQYRAALDVMQDGLERDSSVAAFADFTGRLGGVVQIEESVSPGDAPADPPTSPSLDSLP